MKHDLQDITFVIPFHKDSQERETNILCILKFLFDNFNTGILTIEDDDKFMHEGIWYRTKAINEGLRNAKTKFVAIYDTDVIFPPDNIVKAYELLKGGHTLIYPYSGKLVDINRSYIYDGEIKEKESYVSASYGGAVFVNKEKYKKCGWENENIIGWGFEDYERVARVRTLDHSIARVEGTCYHIQHPINQHSSPQNPFWKNNEGEYYRIKNLSKEELEDEIKRWKWTK